MPGDVPMKGLAECESLKECQAWIAEAPMAEVLELAEVIAALLPTLKDRVRAIASEGGAPETDTQAFLRKRDEAAAADGGPA